MRSRYPLLFCLFLLLLPLLPFSSVRAQGGTPSQYDIMSVLELIDLAWQKADQGLWAEAIPPATRAIERDPLQMMAYDVRARGYWGVEQWDLAFADMETMTRLDSAYFRPYWLRGLLYMHFGLPEKTIEEATIFSRISPDNAVINLMEADAYQMLGDDKSLQSAEAKYQAVLKLDRLTDEQRCFAYLGLGDVALVRGDPSTAVEIYNQAVDAASYLPDGYRARASARMMIMGLKTGFENVKIADDVLNTTISDFTQVIDAQPNVSEAYDKRALLYIYQKNYAAALADLKKAWSLWVFSDAPLRMAEIAIATSNQQGALSAYKMLLDNQRRREDPDGLVVLNNRARLYMKMRQYDKAKADLDEALSRDFYWPATYANLGDWYTEKKQDAAALVAYRHYLLFARDTAQPEYKQHAEQLETQFATAYPFESVSEGCLTALVPWQDAETRVAPHQDEAPNGKVRMKTALKVTAAWLQWYAVELPNHKTGWIYAPYVLTPQGPACANLPSFQSDTP